MISILVINFICLYFAYLYAKGKMSIGLSIAFIFQFVFFSLRTDYGNDFDNYFEVYEMFSNIPVSEALSSDYQHFEIGWRLLCVCLRDLGFQSLVIITQAIVSISYYIFIKDCIPKQLTLFALFVYLFNPDYMLLQLSMMREGIAIGFIVLSITSILKKNYLLSFIFTVISILFHRTAVVFSIVYIFLLIEPHLRKNVNKYIAICFVLLFPLVSIIISKYGMLLFQLDSFARYENYLERTDGLTFGIGNIFEFILYGLPSFIYYKYCCDNNKERTACQIYLLSYLLYPFATITVILQRLSIYLSIVSIIVIPNISYKMQHSIQKPYVAMYIIYSIYRFISFFYSPIYGKYFIEYHTIFS